MTLGENKKITLSLIEEYSPNNKLLTDDVDIQTKLNLLYATAYQEISQQKKIIKTKEYPKSENEEYKYTEYSLPSNCYQIKNLYGLDKDNNSVNVDYKIIRKEIIFK